MDKSLLLAYLDGRRRPFTADPTAGSWHRAIWAEEPELYLELLADPAADVSQRREVLANLLAEPVPQRIAREDILQQLRAQPVEEALQVLEAVRQSRRNGGRARVLGLSFLLGHEQLAKLAATHRTRLVRLLRHLLGERTWSSVVRCLRTGAVSDRAAESPGLLARWLGHKPSRQAADPEAFLNQTVLRFARDPATAREALRVLAGDDTVQPTDPLLARRLEARRDLSKGAGLPRATLFGLRGTFHPRFPAGQVRALSAAASAAVAVHQDGPLTGLFKRSLAPGGEPPSPEVVSEKVAATAATLPPITATLALVLDLSGSAASSGERANHPAALGLALTALLRDRVREVRLYQVGGDQTLNGSAVARPQGETDLATAIVSAAREQPEAILICTDGYENVRQGDAAAVVRGLRQLGWATPIYQIAPLFVAGEDLARRRLGEEVPILTVSHEREAGELLARVLLAHAPEILGADDLTRLRRLLSRSGGE